MSYTSAFFRAALLVGLTATLGFGKPSTVIEGLDTTIKAFVSTDMLWRGKSWSEESPSLGVNINLDYQGSYIYLGQLSSARPGMGIDMKAGYHNQVGAYRFDAGYINYSWMPDQNASFEYDGLVDLFLKNSYTFSKLVISLDFYQDISNGDYMIMETTLAYTFDSKLTLKLMEGMETHSEADTRSYVQVHAVYPCAFTGGEWEFVFVKSDDTGDTGASLSHTFIF